ncbi:MAG: sigma-70 family RNA polymerase sigma factor [Planctomycetales bacterium]|nr:sigma-70 family RNA polymerase sigma factor [Planctomycetales bacterium]
MQGCMPEINSLKQNADSTETHQLLDRIAQGDSSALDTLVAAHRNYMRRIIELRMEEGLRCRVDPSDIVQETSMAVCKRINEFLVQRPSTFRVWLRYQTLERIVDARRHHFAQKRTVKREYRITDASSMSIAQRLRSGPSQILRKKELAEQVRGVLDRLPDTDREILLLRYMEELTNQEAAEVLGIEPAASRKRLGRAMRRLAELLDDNDISFHP